MNVNSIFINIAVKDVKKTKSFFEGIGFTINETYSDDGSICVIFTETVGFMMMTHEKFEGFTKTATTDSNKQRETIFSIGVETKEQVDEMLEKVIQNGGTEFGETTDWGWLYLRSFKDLDGHHFEVVFMQS